MHSSNSKQGMQIDLQHILIGQRARNVFWKVTSENLDAGAVRCPNNENLLAFRVGGRRTSKAYKKIKGWFLIFFQVQLWQALPRPVYLYQLRGKSNLVRGPL
jgi:hypothetical protein